MKVSSTKNVSSKYFKSFQSIRPQGASKSLFISLNIFCGTLLSSLKLAKLFFKHILRIKLVQIKKILDFYNAALNSMFKQTVL